MIVPFSIAEKKQKKSLFYAEDMYKYNCGMTKEEVEKIEGRKLYKGDLLGEYYLYGVNIFKSKSLAHYDFRNGKLYGVMFSMYPNWKNPEKCFDEYEYISTLLHYKYGGSDLPYNAKKWKIDDTHISMDDYGKHILKGNLSIWYCWHTDKVLINHNMSKNDLTKYSHRLSYRCLSKPNSKKK